MKYTLDQLNKMVEEANENGGDLGLDGLTSIPEGFNPTVAGGLWLNGLKYPKVNRLINGDYVEGVYLYADGILTHIKSERRVGKYAVYIGKIPGRNVVYDGEHYAHCNKLRDGIADLAFKKAKDRGAEQFKDLTLDSVLRPVEAIPMYRIITGACQQGTERFVQSLGKLKESYTVREMIEITKGQYGWDRLREFFDA